MLILKFRKYNNSLYKLSSDFQIVTVLGLQFIIFILQQLHNLITTALLITIQYEKIVYIFNMNNSLKEMIIYEDSNVPVFSCDKSCGL